MKSFVKRFLSSAVAAAMLLTSAAFPTIAGAAEITYLYADLYGVDVVLSEAVGAADTHTVTVTDSSGAAVDFSLKAMQEGITLATDVLSVNFTTPINIGELYTINVDGTEKTFRVNEYSSLDFDDLATSTKMNDTQTITSEGDVDWRLGNTSNLVSMITDNADFGASAQDKKLILYGRDTNLNLSENMPTADATIYADVTLYNVTGDTDFYLYGRGSARHNAHNVGIKPDRISTRQANKFFPEADAVDETSTAIVNYYRTTSGYEGTIDYKLSLLETKPDRRTASIGGTGGSVTVTTADSTQATLAEQFVYSIDESVTPTTARAAARVYDNNTEDTYSGYYGGFFGSGTTFNYTGTSLDQTSALYKRDDNRTMGMSSNSTGLKVIDNILITTCSVVDESVEAPAVVDYYADLYGVDIVYEADPTAAINALVVDPVLKDADGNEVPADVKVNTATNVVSVLADEMLELDTIYTISTGDVEKKFYVKKVFEENFNDATAATPKVGKAYKPSGSDNGIAWSTGCGASDSCGLFITDDTKFGATDTNKKIVMYNKEAQLTISNTNPKVTFYATTQSYDFLGSAVGTNHMMYSSGTGKTRGNLYKFGNTSQNIYLSDAYIAEGETNYDTYYGKWDGVIEADYVTAVAATYGTIDKETTTIPADADKNGETDDSTKATEEDRVISFGTVTEADSVKRAMRAYDFNTEDNYPGYFGAFSALEGEKAAYTLTGYNNKTTAADSNGNKYKYCGLFVAGSAHVLVADDLMVTTVVDIDPDRESAVVTDLYGDSYGIEIEFDKEPIEIEYSGLQVTDADGNEVAIASTELNGTTLRVTYEEMLDRDTKHTISFGDYTRQFIVKTAFEENFDGITENVDPEALATITEEDWSATSAFITDDEKWGASSTDKKLALHNKGAFTSTIKVDNEQTVSAVIENYHNGGISSIVSVNSRFYYDAKAYLWAGNSSSDFYGIGQEATTSNMMSDSGRISAADGTGVRPSYGKGGQSIPGNATIEPENYTKPTNLALGLIGYGYGTAEYPYEKQPMMKLWHEDKIDAASNATGWAPTNVTDEEGNIVYRDIKDDVTAPQVISNIAIRNNGSELDFFADYTGEATPTLIATGVLTDTHKITADAFYFGYNNNAPIVTLLDDILVTTFIDIDPNMTAPAFVDYYADLYGVDIVYAEDPTAAIEALMINPVIKDADGNEVPADVKVTTATNVVSVIAEEMLEVNKLYTLSAGDVEKTFYVKKLFEEDFEDIETSDNYYSTSKSFTNNGITWSLAAKATALSTNTNAASTGAGALVTNKFLGATDNDKHLILRGDSKNLLIKNTNPKVTFYATTKMYKNHTFNGNMGMFTRSAGSKTRSHFMQTSDGSNYSVLIADYFNGNDTYDACVTNGYNGTATGYKGAVTGTGTALGVADIVEDESSNLTSLSETTAASEVRLAMRSYDFDFGNGNDLAKTDRGYYGGFMGFVGQDATYTGTGYNDGTFINCSVDSHNSDSTFVGMHSYKNGLYTVDDVLITTVIDIDPNVTAPAVTGYYADLYGVDIVFEADPTAAVDSLILNPVIKDSQGNVVPSTYTIDAQNKLISVIAEEMLELEKEYTISTGDYTTSFAVVTIFEEDFNDLEASTDNTPTKLSGTDRGINWTLSKGVITSDSKFGASSDDKKALMYHRDNNIQVANTTTNVTFYATTQNYSLLKTSNVDFMYTKGTGKTTGHTFLNGESGQTMRIAHYGLYLDAEGNATTDKTNGTAVTWENQYNGDVVAQTSVKNTYGVIDKETTTITGDSDKDGAYDSGVTAYGAITYGDVTTEASESRRAMRAYDFNTTDNAPGYLGAFAHNSDGSYQYTGTAYDSKTRSFSNSFGIFQADPTGMVLVVDDLMATTCVTMEESAINSVYADTYGMEIEFAAAPAMDQMKPVITNARDVAVAYTSAFDDATNKLVLTFDEPIKTDVAYKLSIGDNYANKGLIVNKVFAENFDAITENVDPAALPESITGEGWSAANAFITDDTKWGASSKDKMLGLNNVNGTFATDVLTSEKNVTVSAKVIYFVNGIMHFGAGGFWTEHYLNYGNAAGTGTYKVKHLWDGMQLNDANDAEGNEVSLYRKTGMREGGYTEADPTTTVGLVGDGLSVAQYPYTEKYAATIDWTNKVVNVDETNVETNLQITMPKAMDNYAIRIKDNAEVSVLYALDGTKSAVPTYQTTAATSGRANLKDSKIHFTNTANAVTMLDDLLVTTYEIQDEFVATGPAEINVTDIYGKTDGVYVEFDEALEATDSFDAIEVYEDGKLVDTAATVSGNTVKLAVDGGIKSGAIYRVVVPADFQPNEDYTVKTEAAKNFKLTIYADEDFEAAVDAEAVAITKGTADNAVAEVIDGQLVLRGGEFTLPQVANATNYNVSFDAKVYTTAMTDANNDEDTFAYYNKVTPTGIKMWYNGGENKANGYEWALGSASLTKNVYSADGQDSSDNVAVPYASIVYGDALYADGSFKVYTKDNDEDFENWYLAADNDATLDDDELELVTESQRTAADYKVVVDKSGKKATYSLNDVVVSSFDGTENAAGASEGIFGVSASVEEFVVIDNIYAYSYEEIKDIAVELTAEGKVKVNNVSSTEKPVVIVVAAYDSNNRMIDAWVAEDVKSIAGFGEYNEAYTVDTTDAVKTKAFVWDSMTSLIPYCTPAQR